MVNKGGETMVDYKKMYFHLFNETQKAIEIMQKAHQDCEEMYINGEETKIQVLKSE